MIIDMATRKSSHEYVDLHQDTRLYARVSESETRVGSIDRCERCWTSWVLGTKSGIS